MNQPPTMTIEELFVCLNSMECISQCTDDDYLSPWHQSLQKNIQDLLETISILEKESTVFSSKLDNSNLVGQI